MSPAASKAQSNTLAPVYIDIPTRDNRGSRKDIRHLNGGLTAAEAESLRLPPSQRKWIARTMGATAFLATPSLLAVFYCLVWDAGHNWAHMNLLATWMPLLVSLGALAGCAVGLWIAVTFEEKDDNHRYAELASAVEPFIDMLHQAQRHSMPSDLKAQADLLEGHRRKFRITATPAITEAHMAALHHLAKLAQLGTPDYDGKNAAAATHLHDLPEVKAMADEHQHTAANRAAASLAAQASITRVGQLIADEKVIASARKTTSNRDGHANAPSVPVK